MQIKIADFAQLRQIAWNRDPAGEVAGEEALALYERNWRYVDHDALMHNERTLIDGLVRDYGNGVLNV